MQNAGEAQPGQMTHESHDPLLYHVTVMKDACCHLPPTSDVLHSGWYTTTLQFVLTESVMVIDDFKHINNLWM